MLRSDSTTSGVFSPLFQRDTPSIVPLHKTLCTQQNFLIHSDLTDAGPHTQGVSTKHPDILNTTMHLFIYMYTYTETSPVSPNPAFINSLFFEISILIDALR